MSGFTDGEGCFRLYLNGNTKTPAARFFISLRKDDESVLFIIQSYLACGAVDHNERPLPSKPQSLFRVDKIADLAGIVVPHFEHFPLMAKKLMDFGLWRQAVEIIYTVNHRPIRTRWTVGERQQFYDIQDALHEQREYR